MTQQQQYLTEENVWWELYFLPFPYGSTEHEMPRAKAQAYIPPLLFYLAVGWLVFFLLLSNESYIEHMLSLMEQRSVDTQAIEMIRIGLEYLVQNRWLCFLIGGFQILTSSVILLVFLGVATLLIRFVLEEVVRFSEVFLVAAVSSFPLTLGNLFYGVLQGVFYLLDDTYLGLGFLIPFEHRSGKIFEILNRFELFSLWFIALLAYRLMKISKEKFFPLFATLLFSYTLSLLMHFLITFDLIVKLFVSF